MQIRAQFFATMLLAIIVPNFLCHAQSVKKDTCYQWKSQIESEFRMGHRSLVDTLFKKYKESDCYKNQKDLENLHIAAEIFHILADQRHEQFRQEEGDTLRKLANHYQNDYQSKVRNLKVKTDGKGYWALSGHWQHASLAFNKNATFWGASVNYNTGEVFFSRIVVSLGAFLSHAPFEIEITNNRNEMNEYRADGYMLKTGGKMSMLKVPLTFSYPLSDGIAIFAGVELIRLWKTSVSNYYHETNYRYIDYPNTPERVLAYTSEFKQDYIDNSFFGSRNRVNPLVGVILQIPFWGDKNGLRMKLGYSIGTSKLSISGVDKKMSLTNFFVGISVDFGLKRKDRNERVE